MSFPKIPESSSFPKETPAIGNKNSEIVKKIDSASPEALKKIAAALTQAPLQQTVTSERQAMSSKDRFSEIGALGEAISVKEKNEKISQELNKISATVTKMGNWEKFVNWWKDLWDWNKKPDDRMINFTPRERTLHMDALLKSFTTEELSQEGMFRVPAQETQLAPIKENFSHRNFSVLTLKTPRDVRGSLFKAFIRDSELFITNDKTGKPQNELENRLLGLGAEILKAVSPEGRKSGGKEAFDFTKLTDDQKNQYASELNKIINEMSQDKQQIFKQMISMLTLTANAQKSVNDQALQAGKDINAPTSASKKMDENGLAAVFGLSLLSSDSLLDLANAVPKTDNARAALEFILRNTEKFPTLSII